MSRTVVAGVQRSVEIKGVASGEQGPNYVYDMWEVRVMYGCGTDGRNSGVRTDRGGSFRCSSIKSGAVPPAAGRWRGGPGWGR